MHEMGIAMEVLRIAEESVPPGMTGIRIKRINLKIGRLSAIVAESLRFCFDVVAKDTLADGAELAIEEVTVNARCQDCGHQWNVDQPVFLCPACKSGHIELLSGRELNIESIEIEEEDDADADQG
jgi:hydrogenase nickel incorporation protein HypA/HybF